MKQFIFFLFIATSAAASLQAQTEKGDWLVGGSMTISTTTNNSQFSIMPGAGYFFARGLAAGADINLSFTKTGDQKNNVESVGPFLRYYFLRNAVFKPLLEAEYTIGNSVTKLPNSKSSNTIGSLFLGGGGAFFINNNVALEGVAGYNRAKVQGQAAQDGFNFRLGFQVFLLRGEVDRVRHGDY